MSVSRTKPPIIVSGPALPEPDEFEPESRRRDFRVVMIGLGIGAVVVVLMWAVMALAVSITSPHPGATVRPSTSVTYTPTVATPAVTTPSGEQDYLNSLSGEWFYNQLGRDAVLAEGYKVCRAYQQGWSEDEIRDMIATDLHLSPGGVSAIKVGAEMSLGC